MPHKQNSVTPTRPRMLVVLEAHPENARLLRATKRKAVADSLDWEVVMVDTPSMRRRLNEQDQLQLLQAVTLAEQMGAQVSTMRANSILEGLQEVLRAHSKAGIPIHSINLAEDKPDNRLWSFLRPTFHKKLQRQLGKDYVITTVQIDTKMAVGGHFARLFRISAKEIFFSLLAVVVATATIYLIDFLWPHTIVSGQHRNKAIIYMIACSFVSVRYGLLAGIIAAAASFVSQGVLFVDPYFRLALKEIDDIANLVIFMIGALAVAVFGSREYKRKVALVKRADRFHSLLSIHRLTLNNTHAAEAIAVLDRELKKLLNTEIVFFLPSPMHKGRLEPISDTHVALGDADTKALTVCWIESKTTGAGAPYNTDIQWRFEPMITANGEVGVLGIYINEHIDLDVDSGRLFSGIADQSALILERLEMGQIAEESRLQAEREKLRSMLLSSVSHDLKTPLASVIGSLSVYRSMSANLSEEHRLSLINTALDEAQRLDSFITNILDMVRIESGQVEMKQDWVKPDELISEVCKRLRQRLRAHTLHFQPSNNPIEVRMDAMMTGQVLQNLLDNAVKYTPVGTVIDVTWEADPDSGFKLHVRDHGPGIPEDKLDKVFDKYARINRQDSQVAGTGLGLAIAKAVMAAQGGFVVAGNHPEGGAIFTISLPSVQKSKKKKVA